MTLVMKGGGERNWAAVAGYWGRRALSFKRGGLPYFTLLWARIPQRRGWALPLLVVPVVGEGFSSWWLR